MMSSSPERAGVEAFEYQEPGTFAAAAAGAAVAEGLAMTRPLGRDTSEDLELRLAAARADGIGEGLQQAQQSFEREPTDEAANVAAAVRAFAQQANVSYSRVEIESVHC